MSLFDSFDPVSKEILKPTHMIRPVAGFPETVVLTFEEKSLRLLKNVCAFRVAAILKGGRDIPVYALRYNEQDLAICQSIIGGAATAALVEELRALGAKRVLLYGACGVLDRAVTAGYFILPTAACRDEGTSYHYLPPADYVEVPTAGRLAEIFEELGLSYVLGKTWTTDAIYRETRANVDKRRAEGCVAVEMECASAMAVGQFRRMPVYQFLYAEDSLDGSDWDPRTWGAVPASNYEKYLRVALETAARL